MRPKATWRNNWVQLGIGTAALLLPPLALGAALYSMLAEPEEEMTNPGVAQAAPPLPPPLPVALPATVGAEPPAFQPPARKPMEGATRARESLPGPGGPAQAAPVQMAGTQAATSSLPADAEGGAAPPAADTPPTPAAPKRNAHRRSPRPQQDPYPVRTWLREMGIQLPNF